MQSRLIGFAAVAVVTMIASLTGAPPAAAVAVTGIAVGDGPMGFAKYNNSLYVPNRNGNSVSVIDLTTNTVSATIPVGTRPIAAATANGYVYLTVQGNPPTEAGKVKRINPTTNVVSDVYNAGAPPYGIVASPDGSRVYVTFQVDNFVVGINTTTLLGDLTVTGITDLEGIAVSGSGVGTNLYVGKSTGNSIAATSVGTGTTTAVTVGSTPRNPLVFGSFVYVPNFASNSVSVINTATNVVTATIPVGTGPYAATGSGSHVFVSNSTAGTISVIDTATNTVATTITLPTGAEPRGMIVDGGKLYVADYANDIVRILPAVTAVTPSSGSSSGGTSISISGSGFASGATVTIGGASAASISVTSDTTLTATTPAGAVGAANVVVTLPGGISGTLTGGFTYVSSGGGSSGGGSGGGGSGGSGGTGTTSTPDQAPPGESTTGATSPAAPGVDQLNPIFQGPNASVVGGPPRFLVGGNPAAVTVTPERGAKPQALNLVTPGLNPPLRMRLEGRGDTADPLGLTEKQVLILQSPKVGVSDQGGSAGRVQPVAVSSGEGLRPNSPVRFYILPNVSLGTLTTNSSGAYSGSVPVPAGLAPGNHTLQVNGFAPDGSVQSLSIAVQVRSMNTTSKTSIRKASVYFDSLSPTLTAKGKAALRALVRQTGKRAITIRCIGYVQPTTLTGNDLPLSTQRAMNVAAYLRTLGARGTYEVRGDGRGGHSGGKSRRVDVSISYSQR